MTRAIPVSMRRRTSADLDGSTKLQALRHGGAFVVSEAAKTEVLLERHEAAIVVQKLMALSDAICCDHKIGGRPDCPAHTAQRSMIQCGSNGDSLVQQTSGREYAKIAFETRSMEFVTCALQDFEQDKVADEYFAFVRDRVEPESSLVLAAVENGNPY